MELQDMAKSLLATKGLLKPDESFEWTDAMVDALLFDALRSAAEQGENPRDHCLYLMQMIHERAEEWLGHVA